MISARRPLPVLLLLPLLTPACSGGHDEAAPVCAPLAFVCAADAPGYVRVSTVGERPGGGLPGPHAQGVGDDLVLENDRVVAVIDALDAPHLLAPTGGNLLDFAAVGREDELNQIYQVAGILPDDALHYESMDSGPSSGGGVAVMLRGHLDGRRDVAVLTRYELRPCEPGLRVRTELYNGGHEPFVFFVADVAYWGGREPLPFAPLPEQGFVQPTLDLVDLDASWGRAPFIATDTGLAWVSCSRDRIEGVSDDSVTAVGEPRQIVHPGERVVYERFLVAGDGRHVEAAARTAQEVRRQLGRKSATLTLAGTVVDALSQGPPAQRVDLVVSELHGATSATPISQTVAATDGSYSLTIPEGAPVRLEAWQFGRLVAVNEGSFMAGQALPDFELPAPARVHVDTGLLDATVVLVPADAVTRDAVRGTQLGRFDACAPWLGPPHGGSPACNRALVRGSAELLVPAGHYFVYASAGPLATLARQEITVLAGEAAQVTLAVTDLRAQLAPGRLSTDLHVHGRASFDSGIPDPDRVLSFVSAGVDVLAATDHDAVQDYAGTLADLGVGDRVVVMAGVETTGLIPFMKIPGDSFPRVIGHFNFWPVAFAPTRPRAGAPWDELVEPGALFDLMQTVMPVDGLMMLNHPWDEPLFGRDLGYLRAVGFDPRRPIPLVDDGSAQGVLARQPGGAGGHGNLDFDVLEVLNGKSITKFLQYRQIWWALLAQGRVHAGAANSDSHGLSDVQIGWPRNLVTTTTTLATFDASVLDADIRAGHMVGGYGIVIDASIDGQPFGLAQITPAPDATLDVTVRAAPWIPVTEVRVIVNGAVGRSEAITLVPADPFGTDGLVRYSTPLPLAELLAGVGPGDAWIVVEAGLPLPLVADLDDDGIVDTSDNDGDSRVDQRDVEPDEDHGPLSDPPDPDPWSDDPRRYVTAVAPGTWPTAFTNPFLIDRDGDGVWTAPGL